MFFSGTDGDTYQITGENQVTTVPARYKNVNKGVNYLQNDMSVEVDRLVAMLGDSEREPAQAKSDSQAASQRQKQFKSQLQKAKAALTSADKVITNLERELNRIRSIDDDQGRG